LNFAVTAFGIYGRGHFATLGGGIACIVQ
jgi:hypothetical protein